MQPDRNTPNIMEHQQFTQLHKEDKINVVIDRGRASKIWKHIELLPLFNTRKQNRLKMIGYPCMFLSTILLIASFFVESITVFMAFPFFAVGYLLMKWNLKIAKDNILAESLKSDEVYNELISMGILEVSLK